MAGHAHALRWWRTTCRLRHQLPRSQNFSSFPVSDASSSSSPPPLRDAFLSSCKFQTSTPRALSTLQSNEPLGLSRRIGLAFSRDFSNEFDQAGGSLGMAPWFSGGFRHASTATSENSKPAEEVAEGITLTDNCIRVGFRFSRVCWGFNGISVLSGLLSLLLFDPHGNGHRFA